VTPEEAKERAMRKLLGLGLVVGMLAGAAFAKDVPVEVSTLDGAQITLHVQPFLKDDELKVLRTVASNSQALAVFVPGDKSHYSAMALAPKDGFLKDGAPADTAVALSDFPDADAAAKAALEACDAKRAKAGKPCVLVLEIGPKP
jgi:hypothetical protein